MDDLVQYFRQQGVSEKGIKNLLGQFKAEGGGAKVENLNWSPKTLLKFFGKPGTYTINGKPFVVKKHGNKVRFNTLKEAEDLVAKGEQAIGDVLYGGRMGNAPNEGYKFRGRTALQITGKDAYEAIDKKLGLNGALLADPDLINDPAIEQKAIFSFLSDYKNMKPSDFDDMAKLHRNIGPATGGVGSAEYKKRVKYAQQTQLPPIPLTGLNEIPYPVSEPQYASMEELLGAKGLIPASTGQQNQEYADLGNPLLINELMVAP